MIPGNFFTQQAGILQTKPLTDTTLNEGTGYALSRVELSSGGSPSWFICRRGTPTEMAIFS
jgi:hypothetical protein